MQKVYLQFSPTYDLTKRFYLLLLFLTPTLFSSVLSGQIVFFDIVDAKHNRNLNVGNQDQVFHKGIAEEVIGELNNDLWQFIAIKKDNAGRQLYHIENTKYPGRSIAVHSDENNRGILFGPVNANQTPDRHLWRLEQEVDTAGIGLTYRIINHHFPKEILGGSNNYNGSVLNYHVEKSVDIGKQCSWRLIHIGLGIVPPEKFPGAGYVRTTRNVIATENNTRICIYGLPTFGCSGFHYNFIFTGKPGEVSDMILDAFDREYYSRLISRLDYPVTIYIENFSNGNNFTLKTEKPMLDTIYNPNDPVWSGNSSMKIGFSQNTGSPTKYVGKLNYMVPNGSAGFLNKILFTEYNQTQIPLITEIKWVGWASGLLDGNIKVLNTFTEPQMPTMILHDPPGDASFSEFSKTRRTCRQTETSISSSHQHDLNAEVHFGISASIGFIFATTIDISSKFTMAGSKGNLQISTSATETCLETNETFRTSDIGPGGNDIFLMLGRNLECGIGNILEFDSTSCDTFIIKKQMYCAQVGPPNLEAYSEANMKSKIEALEAVWRDSINVGNTVSKEALYQMRAFQQTLDQNTANMAEAALNTAPFGFNGGLAQSYSSQIDVSKTTTMQVEQFLSANTGFEFSLDIAGNGGGFGYSFMTERKFGATTTESQSTSDLLKYEFNDANAEDEFELKIGKDPQFGTPVFIVDQNLSQTSCPYEGGYQRDQPKLKHDGTSNEHITSLNNPVGSSSTFKLDICNESKENRDYYLKLNAGSNLNGAEVFAAGVKLNENDLGQKFSVSANACLQDLVIEVRQLSANSPLSYPNLELFLYSECDPDIQSSVFASIYFGDATSVNDVNYNNQLSVYPNPTSGNLNINLLEGNTINEVKLMDVTGRIIRIESIIDNTQSHQMDVSNLPAGLYNIQVQSNEKLFVKKVMIE